MRRVTPSILSRPQFKPYEGPPLYHGTASTLEGGKVHPTEDVLDKQSNKPLAWASEDIDHAKGFAFSAARAEGRLFGSVYEVTPSSGGFAFRHSEIPEWVADKVGQTQVSDQPVAWGTENPAQVARTREEFDHQREKNTDFWTGEPLP